MKLFPTTTVIIQQAAAAVNFRYHTLRTRLDSFLGTLTLPDLRFRRDTMIGSLTLPSLRKRDDRQTFSGNFKQSATRTRPSLAKFGPYTRSAVSRSATPDADLWGDAWTDNTVGQTTVNHGNATPLAMAVGVVGVGINRAWVAVDLTRFTGLNAVSGVALVQDDSGLGHDAAAVGNPTITAGTAGFTNRINTSEGNYLSIPTHADFDFNRTNMTIDVRFKMAGASCGLVGIWRHSNNAQSQYLAYIDNGSPSFVYINGPGVAVTLTGTSGFNDNIEHDMRVKKIGTALSIECPVGTVIASTTISEGVQAMPAFPIVIGQILGLPADAVSVDEVRLSNIVRSDATATPFTSDANTLLLLHMDGFGADTGINQITGVFTNPSLTTASTITLNGGPSALGGGATRPFTESTITQANQPAVPTTFVIPATLPINTTARLTFPLSNSEMTAILGKWATLSFSSSGGIVALPDTLVSREGTEANRMTLTFTARPT